MAKVVLIRAGRTDYDDQHRVLGNLDMPVNERGNGEITEAIAYLRESGIRPEVILSSPDDPASTTAHAIAEALVLGKVKELDEFRNVNQGLWQGLCEADVRRRFPRIFRTGGESSVAIRAPEGESLSDACQRLARCLEKSLRRHQTLAIVAPEPLATVIRCTLQQRRPRTTDCLCGESSADPIVVVDTDVFDADAFISGTITPVLENAGPKAHAPGTQNQELAK